MAKNKISEYSSNPANNTDIAGIDIAEGCAPSGINNAIRELMAQLKDMITGADGDSQVVGGNLTVIGTATGVTPIGTDNSTNFATTAFVQSKVGALGTMSTQNASSVAITGGTIAGATGTTAATSTSNTLLATNAFVQQEITAGTAAPYATSSVKGVVRISVSGTTLNIYTTA